VVSYLIRSTSHGNGVAVIQLDPPDIFRKISRTPGGDRYVESEYQGLTWYAERLGKAKRHFIKNRHSLPGYSRIDIHRIDGIHPNYRDSISANEKILCSCIQHYIDTWPNDVTVPCHGDLTLDNVLSTGGGPIFFDWEHFSSAGEAWGFDAAYLLMSAAALSYSRETALPASDEQILRRMWQTLIGDGLSGQLAVRPLEYFRAVFRESSHWKGIVERSPEKLFPVWLEKGFIDYIHQLLGRERDINGL
jgi:hypothetical protein